jgi:hypothetical protein
MSPNEKRMKPIDDEITRIDAEIARLEGKREGLLRAKTLIGQKEHVLVPPSGGLRLRTRSPNIKPLILDIMTAVEANGATSAEVSARVKDAVPTVAKDTVGSILSRLKADGALAFDGERYYASRFAQKADPRPFPEPRILKTVG